MSAETAPMPLLLDASKASAYLGVSRTEFRRWVRDGRMIAPVDHRKGERRRWSRLALEEFSRTMRTR